MHMYVCVVRGRESERRTRYADNLRALPTLAPRLRPRTAVPRLGAL